MKDTDLIQHRYVRLSGVDFSYPNRPIFRNFCLETQRNSVVLKGPSGCGKSTLLRLLFGTLRPNAGSIQRPERAYLILQEDGLFPWMTGYQNILEFCGIDKEVIDAHELFPLVRTILPRRVYELSYGQRRTIELFRGILAHPALLLLDEPLNFLDDDRANEIIKALLALSLNGSQLVVTTHRHDNSLDAQAEVFLFSGDPPYSKLKRVT